jgi:small subunit ribosomal protein S13
VFVRYYTRRNKMPRILGIDIPKEKRIEISLTYLYGVGRSLSNKLLKEAGVNPDKRAKDLTEEEVSRVTNTIQKSVFKVEGDLRREISQNIKRLVDIGSWRGMRHKKGLPVRGQRTRTNARTRKGPKRGGMAVIKKEEPAKKAAPKPAK